MGDSPHDTRQTLLLIKEMLVDPLEKRLEKSSEERREQHDQVMAKLADLDGRSLSTETAKRLRVLATMDPPMAGPLSAAGAPDGASSSRIGMIREAMRMPETKWMAAMVILAAGLICMAIVFTGRSVHGVVGAPPAATTPGG